MNHGFVSLKELKKINKLIVWTMHDMWQLTAGCHYDNFFRGFTQNCNNCPQLNYINNLFNFISFILNLKKSYWENKKNKIDLKITIDHLPLFRNNRINQINNYQSKNLNAIGFDQKYYKILLNQYLIFNKKLNISSLKYIYRLIRFRIKILLNLNS